MKSLGFIEVSSVTGAVDALVKKFEELATDTENCPVFVSQANCLEEVKALDEALNAKFGRGFTLITEIGPVIGSHAGPGTVAISFLTKQG